MQDYAKTTLPVFIKFGGNMAYGPQNFGSIRSRYVKVMVTVDVPRHIHHDCVIG